MRLDTPYHVNPMTISAAISGGTSSRSARQIEMRSQAPISPSMAPARSGWELAHREQHAGGLRLTGLVDREGADAALPHQAAPAVAVLVHDGEERHEAGPVARLERLLAFRRPPRGDDRVLEFVAGVLDDRGEQALLGPEVVIDDRLGDSRRVGDHLHGRVGESVLPEDPLGDRNDLPLALEPAQPGSTRGSGQGAPASPAGDGWRGGRR